MKLDNLNNDKVTELINRIVKAAGEVGTSPIEIMHTLLCVYAGITSTLGINKEKATELLNIWMNECPEKLFNKDAFISDIKLSN